MEFSRVGQHTIKCIISEEEIEDLGYSIEDIMSNNARTQEFMNHIFDLAEQKFEMKFALGVKTVRADFLSDHTISLTFSEHPITSSGMMQHLKDIVSGLIQSIPEEELKAHIDSGKAKKTEKDNKKEVHVMLQFQNMEHLIRFSKNSIQYARVKNALYKWEEMYYLFLDLTTCKKEEVSKLSSLTDEFANRILTGKQKTAFVFEHGKCLIKEKAIETLSEI